MVTKKKYGQIQIEVTSRCNLRCKTCLLGYYEKDWRGRDLGLSIFSNLLPDLQKTESIHLQGWGEPLLVENLEEYIRQAKAAGCLVSFTTNGTLLDSRRAESLILSGVDGITFSLAGATPALQDGLRGAGTHEKFRHSVTNLMAAKKRLGMSSPKTAVSYLLTPESVWELPNALKWCRKLKIEYFSAIHLTHASTEAQEKMQLFIRPPSNLPPLGGGKVGRRLNATLMKANILALLSGIKLDIKPFKPSLIPICDKDPLSNLFVSSDGLVSPCVFLNPPINGSVPWRFEGREFLQPPLIFGNISEQPLEEIWSSEQYRSFRQVFKARLEIYNEAMSKVGVGMEGPEQLEYAKRVIKQAFKKNPPPMPCACCYKMKGF